MQLLYTMLTNLTDANLADSCPNAAWAARDLAVGRDVAVAAGEAARRYLQLFGNFQAGLEHVDNN